VSETFTYDDYPVVKRLQENEEAAFTEIYQQYWKLLFSVAANKLTDVFEAEEVVQDVLADLWIRRHSLSIEHSLKSYLAAAVKFKVYTRLAKRYRQAAREAGLSVPEIDHFSPEEQLHYRQLQQELFALAQELPEKCRLIYQLSREEGLSNREIAEKLSISQKTVETQITRALKKLRSGFKMLLFRYYPA
jgi:RNA polymerase sigma-70 factor (ECF subfamily)